LVGAVENLPPRDAGSESHGVRHVLDPDDHAELVRLQDVAEGIILAGAGLDDPEAVLALGERLGWPVVADPRSGCRNGSSAIVHADAILRHPVSAERLVPKLILRLGEPPASKVVNQWVANSGAHIVAVSEMQRRIDPDQVVSRHIVARVSAVAAALDRLRGERSWCDAWQGCEDMARSAIDDVLDADRQVSEPWVARVVSGALDDHEALMVSSSMPIRDVEWFAKRCPRVVVANRGVNGIDGVVSTGIGVALGSEKPVTVLIGDVAFLHDSNSLINLAQRNVAVRVVVVDNNGGGIFSFLDQARTLDSAAFERFFGTPHGSDLTRLALAHGIEAQEVDTREGLLAALRSKGCRVIVVKTNREENVLVHDRLNRAVAAALDGLVTGE
jgi:2-succinyl-5-enolpyruvyl-6-hydroxy-3-cyclohexene-1-carboxylate synthase